MESKTSLPMFCAKPFTWFEVSRGEREGDVFLCCPSWLDTPIGNLDEQSVEELWNGPVAQQIRATILDGSFSMCRRDRCPFLQTETGPVQPRAEVNDTLLRAAIEDNLLVLPYGPREINCCYDRSCNLSCPSCRTGILVETNRRDQISEIQRKISTDALPGAEFLSITGSGDPFGSPFFRQWLRSMRREDMPALRHMHLHTNALLWTPAMWETLSPDIRALVHSTEISIDAARAETYAINRRGGDFAVLLRNLDFVSTLRRDGPITELSIHMVVQQNNFREMPEFVALGRRVGADRIYFSKLMNWGTFSEEEYASRTVHDPLHPDHSALREVLRDLSLLDEAVDLGNLTELHARRDEPLQPVAPVTTGDE